METIKSFEQRTRDFIADKHLLTNDRPIIVALSGGADSVALVAVLSALGYDCRAAHCNFHLRGDESMRDMNHAIEICNILNIKLDITHFDVGARQAATKESVEMACRELRYDWFNDLLIANNAQAIAVGHHCEDRAETFLLNLLRGTGINGLVAMHAKNNAIIRPLLPFTRNEIENYVRARGLTWVDDSSNKSNAHRRNRLRNHVFPMLEELFPGATNAILATIGNLESVNAIYSAAANNTLSKYICGNSVDILGLAQEPHAATLLFNHIQGMGFTYSQACNMLTAAKMSGKQFISANGSTIAELAYGKLTFSLASACENIDEVYDVDITADITSPISITINIHDIKDFRLNKSGATIAYIDHTAIAGNWQLRHWRQGDRIIPFGKTKSKLVSDIFAQAHFSAEQKRKTWILTCNDEIVWIPGLRNSALFKIDNNTKKYIRLELKS